ncbi:hypothetical protein MOQ_002208 [Trypanosoma cruzi marinkellei]|uniref:Uncharacterized protein n=1 Tax=Trypanosoma cruzi marinkellei TaxID=85056 RepID=K2P952_TRYCR|nr:hypothetical protein MOQ_002208 [Trypanosoma cruzi marinkellei]
MVKGDMQESGVPHASHEAEEEEEEEENSATVGGEQRRPPWKEADSFRKNSSMGVEGQTDMMDKPDDLPPVAITEFVLNTGGTGEGKKEQRAFVEDAGQLQQEQRPLTGGQNTLSMVPIPSHSRKSPVGFPIAERVGALTGSVMHDIIHAEMSFQGPPKLTLQPRPQLTPLQKPNASREWNVTLASDVFSMSPGTVASRTSTLKTASNGSPNQTPSIPCVPPNTWRSCPVNGMGVAHDTAKRPCALLQKNSLKGGIEALPASSSCSPVVLKPLAIAGTSGGSSGTTSHYVRSQNSRCLSVPMPSKISFASTEDPLEKNDVPNYFLHESAASMNKSSNCSTARSGANSNVSVKNLNVTSNSSQPTQHLSFPLLGCSKTNGLRNSEDPMRISRNECLHHTQARSVGRQGSSPQNDLEKSSPQEKELSTTSLRQTGGSHVPSPPCQQQGRKMRSIQELLVQEVVSQLRLS